VLVLIMIVTLVFANDEDASVNQPATYSVVIEHSLDGGKTFVKRGTITTIAKKASSKSLSKSTTIQQASISNSDWHSLITTASQTGGLYFLRAPKISTVSVPACWVVLSKAVDEITLLFDPVSLQPMFVDYFPEKISDRNCTVTGKSEAPSAWKTKAFVELAAEGPKPLKAAEPLPPAAPSKPWYLSWWIWIVPAGFILMTVFTMFLPEDKK